MFYILYINVFDVVTLQKIIVLPLVWYIGILKVKNKPKHE